MAKPNTILTWYRRLIAQEFDDSKTPQVSWKATHQAKLEALILQMAKENPGWSYDGIVGALANLGYRVSDETVGNILKRHGIAPAPKRSQTANWKESIYSHMAVMDGIDFVTVEVLTWCG